MSDGTRYSGASWRRIATDSAPAVEGGPARVLSLVACSVLAGSFLAVPIHVTDVVGGSGMLALLVTGTVLLATALGLWLPDGLDLPVGVALGLGFLVAGLGGYLLLIPDVYYALFSFQRVYVDTAALLAGQSVLLLLDADLWILGITPAPLFLTWFFALRRRYELAAIVGGATLGFFTLTGDASTTTTVVGMSGALGALGFGSIERWNGSLRQLQDVGLVIVAAVLVTRFVDVVPDGGSSLRDVLGEDATLEGTLVGSPGQVPVVGSISLSPAVRFVVRAQSDSYWRVASYDRYTGQGWVSTGDSRAYEGTQSGPPGNSREVEQYYEFRADTGAMPAAWKPVYVEDSQAADTRVSDDGGLQSVDGFESGEGYRVVSRVPEWTADELRESEKAYPARVRQRYLQLPDSTPTRLGDRASEIADAAGSPYETVMRLRDWLQSEKSYSLEVSRPTSDVADEFVFGMEEGYCVYFATALAVMLRSIGIPARFVVGYSTGERVDQDRYRVRGLHSHAWTEVFFPETGWITVDPTPSEPRSTVRQQRLEEGGSGDGTGGGIEGAETPTPTPFAPGRDPDAIQAGNGSGSQPVGTMPAEVRRMRERSNVSTRNRVGATPALSPNGTAGAPGNDGNGSDSGGSARRTDAGDRLTLLAGVAGLAIGAYRIGVLERLYRSVWVRRQTPTDDPQTDVERAFQRLEYHLSREYRERSPDETPRAYVSALDREWGADLDRRIYRVLELYEQIRYSDDPRPMDAKEAIQLVDDIVDDR